MLKQGCRLEVPIPSIAVGAGADGCAVCCTGDTPWADQLQPKQGQATQSQGCRGQLEVMASGLHSASAAGDVC